MNPVPPGKPPWLLFLITIGSIALYRACGVGVWLSIGLGVFWWLELAILVVVIMGSLKLVDQSRWLYRLELRLSNRARRKAKQRAIRAAADLQNFRKRNREGR